MSTITQEQQEAIKKFVFTHHIPAGLGSKEEACSVAAINLALTGELTDTIPACMSRVIGRWITGVQDSMSDAVRNSDEWRSLLPLAAGTGREHEEQRSEIVLNWMWEVVLPELQPIADEGGYGIKWKAMTTEKTSAAADDARSAADAGRYAAYAGSSAADAGRSAAYAADDAADAGRSAADAGSYAAYAGRSAADAFAAAASYADAARKTFWYRVNPVAVLKELIDVETL